MAIDEHFQRGRGPVGLATSDGFPWARLVTGVVAVAISMTLGWRAEQWPVELAMAPASPSTQAPATDPDAPRAPEVVTAPALPEALPLPPPLPVLVARMPERGPAEAPKRHQFQRTASRAKAPSDVMARRKAGRVDSRSAGFTPVARATLNRRRAEVRNEYIAARDQVAALTGEDSGSDYLARMAARQRPERTVLAGHAHHKGQPGRRAPARS